MQIPDLSKFNEKAPIVKKIIVQTYDRTCVLAPSFDINEPFHVDLDLRELGSSVDAAIDSNLKQALEEAFSTSSYIAFTQLIRNRAMFYRKGSLPC